MISWESFIERQKKYCESIESEPSEDFHFAVVIPCLNEPNLLRTINSLQGCKAPGKSVEVIIVINASETAGSEIVARNQKTFDEIRDWEKTNPFSFFKIQTLVANQLPRKDAGAGLARKIGMDEAIRRFERIGNYSGIIVSLDADTIVEPNYFTEIEKFFHEQPMADGCNIFFEHPAHGDEFNQTIYDGIVLYELFLRYYIQALRTIKYPFSFHTIGSGFAVKSDAYVRQGGMNKRTAGEDFYFLQKLIPHGRFFELNTTAVYPSPRVSDRVPFGTGAAMKEFVVKPGKEILAYHPKSFEEINRFMQKIEVFFNSEIYDEDNFTQDACLREFLKMQKFSEKLKEIKLNSRGLESFRKRFFNWFNAFRVFKFLNYAHENCYEKLPVNKAALDMLGKTGINPEGITNNYELLQIYRRIQRNEKWEVRL